MFGRTILATLLITFLLAGTLFSQAPAAEKVKLEGRVVTTSGGPVRRATVVLSGRGPVIAAESDDEGRFSFGDLTPGQVSVQALRNGYLDVAPVYSTIAAGTQPLTIVMTRESILRGTVTDEFGEPFPNAVITIATRMYQNGGWQLNRSPGSILTSSITTGPDGTYVMGGLPAGKYYVNAEESIGRTSASYVARNATLQGPQRAYVPTFHPGVTELSLATVVTLPPETELRGIDIRMRRINVFSVRGTIAGPPGTRAPDLKLTPLNGVSPSLSLGRLRLVSNQNGTFEFAGVPPGIYVLQTQASVLTARQIITVGDRDVDRVTLQPGAGAKISGTIRSVSSPALPEITLTPENGVSGPQTARTQRDGTYEFPALDAGAYRVSLGSSARTIYIQSLTMDGQPVPQRRIELSTEATRTLAVVAGTDVSEVTGIVRDDRGQPVPRARVTIWQPGGFPSDANATYNITDTDGSIRFFGLPPGEYRIAAWETVEPGLPEAPEFLKQFDGSATSVTLGSSAKEKLDAIKLIRSTAIETATAKMP